MPDVSITKGITLDLLETPGTPALSSTSDLPVVETKPDAQNEGAPPELPAAGEEAKPAETPEQPGESATPATEEHPGEPAKKESRGVQKALDRLTAEREEQRRRAEAAEQRLDRALTALERSTGEPAEAGRRPGGDENPEPESGSSDPDATHCSTRGASRPYGESQGEVRGLPRSRRIARPAGIDSHRGSDPALRQRRRVAILPRQESARIATSECFAPTASDP